MENHQVFAVSGNGVNNTPALKKAAEMVVTDGNLVSIDSAVSEWEKIFGNLYCGSTT